MKNIKILLFCVLVSMSFCVLSMQLFRRASTQRGNVLQRRSLQTKSLPPKPTSIWNRIEQSISSFIDQIRTKYYSSPNVSTPIRLGQSEITSMPIAAMAENLAQKDINNALEVIQQNRKMHNLENDMNGLLRCGYPGPEFLIISEIKSIDQFEKFFEDMRRRILLSIGFDTDATEKLLTAIKEKRAQAIKNFYTNVRFDLKVVHENLPQLETIKNLLIRVSINPQTLPIKFIPKWQALKNIGEAAYVKAIFNSTKDSIIGTELCLNPLLMTLEGMSLLPGFKLKMGELSLQNFIIAHEIGHLLRNHCEEIKLISDEYRRLFPYGSLYSQKSLPHSLSQPEEQLDALYELEADITVALLLPQEVSKLLWEIGQAYEQADPSHRNITPSPIHSSLSYKLGLFRRIFNLYSQSKESKLKQIKE